MGFISNMPEVETSIELSFQKVRQMTAQQYRYFVWAVFLRILDNTPQSTGRAVANWNIGVNSPDLSADLSLGDAELFQNKVYTFDGGKPVSQLRQQGDSRWVEVAKRRAQPRVWGPGGGPRLGFKRGGLTYRDKVFITNSVEGDDDEGNEGVPYLADLQDPSFAVKRLRAANQPYENAQESVIVVASRMLGRGFSLPKVSGGSWQ